jgi:hypothetical protein
MPDTIWKGATQGSFQQSLVEIGSVVSEEKIFFKFHPTFFLFLAWWPSWFRSGDHWTQLWKVRRFGPSTKMAPTAELSLTQDPMGNSHKNLLLRNLWTNCNQIWWNGPWMAAKLKIEKGGMKF